jgi:arabinogalactan oligomer/maltooligosaccharide transport system permease protein
MRRLNLMRVLICLLSVVVILSACAETSDEPPQPSPVASVDQAPPPAATPQPLFVWHPFSGAEREALEHIRLEYEAAHPDTDIQLKFFEESVLQAEYRAAVIAGAGPDVLFGPSEWLHDLASEGLLQLIGPDSFDQITEYVTEPIAYAASFDGIPYGVAYSAEFAVLYTNRDLVSTPPEAYEDLLTEAESAGMVIPPTFFATSALYFIHDRQLINSSGRLLIALPTLQDYLSDVQALAASPGVVFSTDQASFLQGDAGLLIASSEDLPALRSALGDNLGIGRLPDLPPNPWRALLSPRLAMLNINSTTEGLESAASFLIFLISPDTQRYWFEHTHHAPVNVTALDDTALRQAWGHALSWGVTAPLHTVFATQLQPALDQAVQAVALNGNDPVVVAGQTLAAFEADQ